MHETSLVQPHASHRVYKRPANQIVDLAGRLRGRKPGRSNIGYAVAVRIHHSDPRTPGDIGAERVSGRQAGALSYENQCELCVHQFTDLVADRDASLLDENQRTDRKPTALQKRSQATERGQEISYDSR